MSHATIVRSTSYSFEDLKTLVQPLVEKWTGKYKTGRKKLTGRNNALALLTNCEGSDLLRLGEKVSKDTTINEKANELLLGFQQQLKSELISLKSHQIEELRQSCKSEAICRSFK